MFFLLNLSIILVTLYHPRLDDDSLTLVSFRLTVTFFSK